MCAYSHTTALCNYSFLVRLHNSDTFELCSFDALSKTIRRDVFDLHMSDAFVACITSTLNAVEGVTLDNSVLSGKGTDHHGVLSVIEQFNDVLVSAIPGGLSPERFDSEGNLSTPPRSTPTLSRSTARPAFHGRGGRGNPTILTGFSCQGLGCSIPVSSGRACVVCAQEG